MIKGSIVALVTPMLDDGGIDHDALAALVDWHVASGTDGIVAVGTTGESATLDMEEHVGVMRFIAERARGRIPVIGGTGANSTREAIELTQAAKEVGCDAALLVTPYYNKPTQEGLYLHHKAIAEAVALPQILYNVPGRTACDMKPDTIVRLASVPNIVGVKEATGELSRARDILARAGSDFAVYSGDDATAVELILLGGHGDISVTANVAPAQMHAICASALAGDATKAQALNAGIAELHQVLFVEANPIPVKWALHEMGRIGAGIRLPLTPLSETQRPVLRAALVRTGLVAA
ncbi:MAG: 4-hydroxy-tetrahydrodipicolinate synthase [Gammaproteobacteria bacterium]